MENLKSLKGGRIFQNSLIVHILITTFGISAWLGINAIFVELPLLVNSLPEEWNLPMYLVIMIQMGNIGPMSYGLAKKLGFEFRESRWIFGLLVLGTCVMFLLVFFYDRTATFSGNQYSLTLFIVTFFTALVDCSSSVLFMPYLRHFREIYLVSYFIGEGLSGIIPSVIALVQGTGTSQCNGSENFSQPRFSAKYYFLCIFLLLLFSLGAFLLLETLQLVRSEKVEAGAIRDNGAEIREEIREENRQENGATILEEVGREKSRETEKEAGLGSSFRIYLYLLLGLMCLLANGFLPGIQSYSALPYGSVTYHLTVTLSQLANPVACFLAMLFPPLNSRIINWLSAVALVICSYVIYLAFQSPRPPLQYSTVGQVLVILSWILLIGLISYVKLAIASIFRHESRSGNLFRIGIVMQVGSAFGAVVSLTLSSFTHLLTSYNSCADQEFPK